MNDLNFEIVLSNIDEALEELQSLKNMLRRGSLKEVEFQISFQHAYNHLNFSWNIRHETTEHCATLSDDDFE